MFACFGRLVVGFLENAEVHFAILKKETLRFYGGTIELKNEIIRIDLAHKVNQIKALLSENVCLLTASISFTSQWLLKSSKRNAFTLFAQLNKES